ncbi:serine-aspartate repeat-containing protein C-like [Procambarus clarkii]|uniref:serine-aspartate repeat-containing protein C-like n=1 Tax=Procambarus clarkii TaxID=6728 RepID=UPI00374219E5
MDGNSSTDTDMDGNSSTDTDMDGNSSTDTDMDGNSSTDTDMDGNSSTDTDMDGNSSTDTDMDGNSSTDTDMDGNSSTDTDMDGNSSTDTDMDAQSRPEPSTRHPPASPQRSQHRRRRHTPIDQEALSQGIVTPVEHKAQSEAPTSRRRRQESSRADRRFPHYRWSWDSVRLGLLTIFPSQCRGIRSIDKIGQYGVEGDFPSWSGTR